MPLKSRLKNAQSSLADSRDALTLYHLSMSSDNPHILKAISQKTGLDFDAGDNRLGTTITSTILHRMVARNRHTPHNTLTNLHTHPDGDVRANVAENNSTPRHVLKKLMDDPNTYVSQSARRNLQWRNDVTVAAKKPVNPRYMVTESIESLRAAQMKVADNGDEAFAFITSMNTDNRDLLHRFAKHKDWNVRANVAANEKTHPDVLHELALDPDVDVREHVARNPSAHPHTLAHLSKDPDHHTSDSARRMLNFVEMKKERKQEPGE